MYNILSVDGRGATQALIATKIIQIIDEKLKKSTGEGVIKHFDQIASSSTTAFPAALIAHGYTPKKTYEIVKTEFLHSFISKSSLGTSLS
jgi:patatin-like phospholipase/acyl hydrolase